MGDEPLELGLVGSLVPGLWMRATAQYPGVRPLGTLTPAMRGQLVAGGGVRCRTVPLQSNSTDPGCVEEEEGKWLPCRDTVAQAGALHGIDVLEDGTVEQQVDGVGVDDPWGQTPSSDALA